MILKYIMICDRHADGNSGNRKTKRKEELFWFLQGFERSGGEQGVLHLIF
jgi:hypothetical protein